MNFTITCLCNMQRILKAVNDEFFYVFSYFCPKNRLLVHVK